ncbi:MAG: hypothetical protein WA667_10705 [Candidatus Nitrosopolaris sp.]
MQKNHYPDYQFGFGDTPIKILSTSLISVLQFFYPVNNVGMFTAKTGYVIPLEVIVRY